VWDLNINFLLESNNTFQLTLLLQSYNIFYTVDFPTRTSTRTAIDNIFIDFCRINSFKVYPVVRGLSDHDTQFLVISNILKPQTNNNQVCKRRLITAAAIIDFIETIRSETWGSITITVTLMTVSTHF
jgi:hypothetical protein